MSMRSYRVLALDGGGIRGLIPARVLEDLETRTGKRIAEMFDLIAGTSTGGILALGLSRPDDAKHPQFTAADMCNMYLHEGAKIFPHSLFQDVKTLHGLAVRDTRRRRSKRSWASGSGRRCSPRR